jgi:hypothetical protein
MQKDMITRGAFINQARLTDWFSVVSAAVFMRKLGELKELSQAFAPIADKMAFTIRLETGVVAGHPVNETLSIAVGRSA